MRHDRSLQDMLSAHLLVKVQLNGDPAGAPELAEQLVEGCGAGLVDVQGRTILLSKGEAGWVGITRTGVEMVSSKSPRLSVTPRALSCYRVNLFHLGLYLRRTFNPGNIVSCQA